MRVRHAVKRGNDHLIDLLATIIAIVAGYIFISGAGWVFVVSHPVVLLISAGMCLPAALPLLRAVIFLPDTECPPGTDADSYTRTRDYHGYDIEVAVEEQPQNKDAGSRWYLERTVSATATDGDEFVARSESIANAGRYPVTIFDTPLGADRNGRSAGDQAQEVLEDLYDQLAVYEATGANGDTTGVDSALDVVFGGASENEHKIQGRDLDGE
jgi:hypothetical protein